MLHVWAGSLAARQSCYQVAPICTPCTMQSSAVLTPEGPEAVHCDPVHQSVCFLVNTPHRLPGAGNLFIFILQGGRQAPTAKRTTRS